MSYKLVRENIGNESGTFRTQKFYNTLPTMLFRLYSRPGGKGEQAQRDTLEKSSYIGSYASSH